MSVVASSCEFSESMSATAGQALFGGRSPSKSQSSSDSISLCKPEVIIAISGTKVIIRDANSLVVLAVHSCVDKIDEASVSPDGQYLLCVLLGRSCVQIFEVYCCDTLDEAKGGSPWTCRINEGPAGLIRAAWTPDSRHIMTESDFGIQMSIWSLIDSSSVVISNPKHLTTVHSNGAEIRTHAFSDCGKYLTVLHRMDLQDYIGLYSTNPWEELTKFRAQTSDAYAVKWIPDGLHIIVADTPLSYKVNVFSPSGQLISHLEAYENALGVRSLNFQVNKTLSSHAVRMMAVASFDGKIRLLSTRSWQIAFVLSCCHPREMESTTINTNENGYMLVEESLNQSVQAIEDIDDSVSCDLSILKTSSRKTNNSNTLVPLSGIRPPSSYIVRTLKSLPHNAVDPVKVKSHPAMGVHWTGFSADGKLLAAKEESYPRCLWLWDMVEVKLINIIVQSENVLDAAWRPCPNNNDKLTPSSQEEHQVLAFCCGSPRIYLWSSSTGISWSDIPSALQPFSITSIRWNDDGSKLILGGREVFSTCTFSLTETNDLNQSPSQTCLSEQQARSQAEQPPIPVRS